MTGNEHGGFDDPRNDPWLQEAFASLELEKQFSPGETSEAMAKKLLRQAADRAATSIIHLATRATSERVRLAAAQYIIERVFAMSGEPDVMTHSDRVQAVGTVLTSAIRDLGLDVQNPEVRETMKRALISIAES